MRRICTKLYGAKTRSPKMTTPRKSGQAFKFYVAGTETKFLKHDPRRKSWYRAKYVPLVLFLTGDVSTILIGGRVFLVIAGHLVHSCTVGQRGRSASRNFFQNESRLHCRLPVAPRGGIENRSDAIRLAVIANHHINLPKMQTFERKKAPWHEVQPP